jgi:hypothetical protein
LAANFRSPDLRTLVLTALLGLLLLPLGGCDRIGMETTTPGEAARDAFNPYDADKRRRAVNLLAEADFGGEPTYIRTYRLLMDDPDPTVRAAAVAALGRHGDVTDVGRIAMFLEQNAAGEPIEPAKLVRWEAAKALQKIHHEDAISALITALAEDPDADVRMAAADALGQYPQRAVFDALVTALRDDDYAVVQEAEQALVTLTGKDFGDRARDWWDWAEQNAGSVFAERQTYYYREYKAPPGMLARAAFWSDEEDAAMLEPRTNVIDMTGVEVPTTTVAAAPPAEPTPTPAPTPRPVAQPQPAPQPTAGATRPTPPVERPATTTTTVAQPQPQQPRPRPGATADNTPRYVPYGQRNQPEPAAEPVQAPTPRPAEPATTPVVRTDEPAPEPTAEEPVAAADPQMKPPLVEGEPTADTRDDDQAAAPTETATADEGDEPSDEQPTPPAETETETARTDDESDAESDEQTASADATAEADADGADAADDEEDDADPAPATAEEEPTDPVHIFGAGG